MENEYKCKRLHNIWIKKMKVNCREGLNHSEKRGFMNRLTIVQETEVQLLNSINLSQSEEYTFS